MKKIAKNGALAGIAAVMAFATLAVGTLAYFSASASLDTGKATAGTLSIGLNVDGIEGGGTLTEQLLNKDFGDVDINNLNPGDVREIQYNVANLGNKAVRYVETITLGVDLDDAYGLNGTNFLTDVAAEDDGKN